MPALHALALLLCAVAARAVAPAPPLAAGLQPQCTPQPLADVSFLGPARSVSAGGVEWSYHRFGNATSGQPPLLLVHGLAGTQYDWPVTVLQGLAQRRELVVFDNPRAGLSNDSSTQPLSIPGMAAATVEFIRALDLPEKPDVLGFSMGGMIALQLAASHSGDIGAAVSVSGSYGGADAPQPEGGIDAVLQAIIEAGPESLTFVFPRGINDTAACALFANGEAFQYAAGAPAFANASGAGYAARQGVIPSAQALTVAMDVKQQQLAAIEAFYTGPGLLPLLANSTTPLLLVGGERDAVIPRATQEAAAAALGATLIEVPEAGHLVHYLRPDEYAEQIAAFLDAEQELNPTAAAGPEEAAGAAEAPSPPPSAAGRCSSPLVGALAAAAAALVALC